MIDTFEFNVNMTELSIRVQRTFHAPLNLVWEAWTNAAIIDQWWAPLPWRSETKRMDFREGGFRLYAMVGPQGERHWAREDFPAIKAKNGFVSVKTFCDEDGLQTPGMPSSHWHHTFVDQEVKTTVSIVIGYEHADHLEMMIKMGFKEGFTMGLENLDRTLEQLTSSH